jgi:amino acid permease
MVFNAIFNNMFKLIVAVSFIGGQLEYLEKINDLLRVKHHAPKAIK